MAWGEAATAAGTGSAATRPRTSTATASSTSCEHNPVTAAEEQVSSLLEAVADGDYKRASHILGGFGIGAAMAWGFSKLLGRFVKKKGAGAAAAPATEAAEADAAATKPGDKASPAAPAGAKAPEGGVAAPPEVAAVEKAVAPPKAAAEPSTQATGKSGADVGTTNEVASGASSGSAVEAGGAWVPKSGARTKVVQFEGGVLEFSAQVGEFDVHVMANASIEGKTLYLRQTHVAGAAANKVGVSTIRQLVTDFGRANGVEAVVVEGAARTTGPVIGRTPSPMRFRISADE